MAAAVACGGCPGEVDGRGVGSASVSQQRKKRSPLRLVPHTTSPEVGEELVPNLPYVQAITGNVGAQGKLRTHFASHSLSTTR